MSFSVDGLASGLDTTSLVNSLMSIERQPMFRMQARMKAFDSRVTAWGEIGKKADALKDAITDLRKVSDFGEYLATSSNESVFTATASSSASPSKFSFTVEALAVAHQQVSTGFASGNALVGTGIATVSAGLSDIGASSVDASTGGLATGGYDIAVTAVDTGAGTATVTFDGTEQTVSLGPGTITLTSANGSIDLNVSSSLEVGTSKVTVVNADGTTTLAKVRDAINGAAAGSSATLINTGNGTEPYKMIVTATSTGVERALDIDVSGLSGFSGAFTDLKAASDSRITVGTETITRASNSISDLLDGVTLNLVAADPGTEVTLDVTHDDDVLVEKVRTFVEAMNSMRTVVDKHSKYNVEAKKGGVLVGDSRARTALSQLTGAMSYTDPALDYSYLGAVGISVDSEGKYSLDEDKLRSALSDNFDHTVKLFTEDTTVGRKGAMGTLRDAVKVLTDPGGLIDAAADAAQLQSDDLENQIEHFEDRMVLVEARYRRQFTALETAMGQLRNQGQWLAGQLGNLS